MDHKTRYQPISAIILAGGQSRRLGKEKSLLPVGDQPLIMHTAQALATLSDDLIVVTNDPGRYQALDLKARMVPDQAPGRGTLMGIYSGLDASQYDHALVVACDMPFLNLPLLRYMQSLIRDHDVILPRIGEFTEPLHAIYGKTCLEPIARTIDQGIRRVVAFLPNVRVRFVDRDTIDRFDPGHLSFVNVNTPEEWAKVQQLLDD